MTTYPNDMYDRPAAFPRWHCCWRANAHWRTVVWRGRRREGGLRLRTSYVGRLCPFSACIWSGIVERSARVGIEAGESVSKQSDQMCFRVALVKLWWSANRTNQTCNTFLYKMYYSYLQNWPNFFSILYHCIKKFKFEWFWVILVTLVLRCCVCCVAIKTKRPCCFV